MSSTLGALLLLVPGCSPDFMQSREQQAVVVSMAAEPQSTNACAVTITIANKGAKSLEFDEDDLPWHITGEAITIALVVEDGLLKTPLLRIPMIVDTVVAPPLILEPGEVRSKQLHLDQYYEGLRSALLRHDVTVLWVYRPCPKWSHPLEPVSGAVTLHRTK
ncbi:MAG TPA: hypothetical protein VJA21_15040 [Verrucomicrobiae bacterium]